MLDEEVPPVYTLEAEWTQQDGMWDCGFLVFEGTLRKGEPHKKPGA